MTIFVYKEMTRDPEIGNISVWIWSNIWRLGRVRDTKFVTNVSIIKCYCILQYARVTVFTVSELLRENQQEQVKILPPARHPDKA